jgi:Tfp pilus assembly protein PilO
MALNNLAKREKILVILGGALIFFYLYYSVFLSPINKSIENEKKVLASKNAEVTAIERLKVSNVSNKKKLDGYVKKFNESVKQLPKNDRNPEIAYNLNDLATKSSINISSVNFGTISDYVAKSTTESSVGETKVPVSNPTTNVNTTSQKLKLVPVTISLTGKYESLLAFISNIESTQTDNRLAEIGSISISTKSDNANLVQASLVLNYYFSEGSTKEQPTYDDLKGNNVGKDNLFN